MLSKDEWVVIQKAYEGGASIRGLAINHGVSRRAIQKHRDNEGWQASSPAALTHASDDVETANYERIASLQSENDHLKSELVSSNNSVLTLEQRHEKLMGAGRRLNKKLGNERMQRQTLAANSNFLFISFVVMLIIAASGWVTVAIISI